MILRSEVDMLPKLTVSYYLGLEVWKNYSHGSDRSSIKIDQASALLLKHNSFLGTECQTF